MTWFRWTANWFSVAMCARAAWVLKKVRKGRQGGHLPLPYTFGQLSVRTRPMERPTDWAARCDPPLYIVAQILSFSISRSQPPALLLLNFLLWVKDMEHNTHISLKQKRRVNLPPLRVCIYINADICRRMSRKSYCKSVCNLFVLSMCNRWGFFLNAGSLQCGLVPL